MICEHVELAIMLEDIISDRKKSPSIHFIFNYGERESSVFSINFVVQNPFAIFFIAQQHKA
jgi:hypothetical protein